MSTAVAPAVSAPLKGMDRIRRALLGGHPILHIQTWEESRIERLVQHLAKTFFGEPVPFGSWSVVDGLLVDGIPVADTRDPLKALDAILQASGKGFYVMKDFPTSPGGRPEIVRRLRDLYRGLARYVNRILRGAKPQDLPVELPTKFELIINLKTAKQIGLTIPQWTLMKADRVIR